MTHLYNWLLCIAALFLVSVNGEGCYASFNITCYDLDVDGNDTIFASSSENFTAAGHAEECRKSKAYERCIKISYIDCSEAELAAIASSDRAEEYLCGEASDTYVKSYACLAESDFNEQCVAFETLNRSSNSTEEEESTRLTEEECRALETDLLCRKQVIKTDCGDDAANVYDTYLRIIYHGQGKVVGCDFPDPFSVGRTDPSSTGRTDPSSTGRTEPPSSAGINTASVLCLVTLMACMLITIG